MTITTEYKLVELYTSNEGPESEYSLYQSSRCHTHGGRYKLSSQQQKKIATLKELGQPFSIHPCKNGKLLIRTW